MVSDQPIAMPVATKKSPPMAFQMTSNDSLVAPPRNYHASPRYGAFHSPDYLNSPAARHSDDYQVSSPMEQDLQTQVLRQAEALRLQHQAFVVERECWEMERERLYKRIASLERLLKSPTAHSPAKSPVISPYAITGPAVPLPASHRSSTVSAPSRLPSIAENDGTPTERRSSKTSFMKRDSAPSYIDLPTLEEPVGTDEIKEGDQEEAIPGASQNVDGPADTVIPGIITEEFPASPPVSRQVLSPPPASYLKNAGHTPLRLPSRPTSSGSDRRSSIFSEHLEDTPTRKNTHRNLSIDVDDDIGLTGPLRLPELPSNPGSDCFTMEALTARLQYIEQHPDENEPLALSARANKEFANNDDALGMASKVPSNGLGGAALSKTVSRETHAEVSPPPASEASFATADVHEHKGIRLKKKPSINFGAPLGQLRP